MVAFVAPSILEPDWNNKWVAEQVRQAESCRVGANPFDCFGEIVTKERCKILNSGPWCSYWPNQGRSLDELAAEQDRRFRGALISAALIMLVPPLTLIIVGLALLWVVKGFSDRPT